MEDLAPSRLSGSDSPPISIVIPVRNGERTLEACLKALHSQSLPREQFEILVVDDGSTDRSPEIAKKLADRVVVQDPVGAAAARNRGIREAQGQAILFTDADCIADPTWVELLSDPLSHDGVEGTVGRCDSQQDHWVAALIQVELDERYSRMGHHERIDFLNTGNCAFRRGLLAHNPFDESFRWLEDVELSFRLAHNGNQMLFVPGARVRHPHPESFWAYVKRKFHYATYAPLIYRRFPGKTFSDSRTPLNRRIQLVGLGLSGLFFSVWILLQILASVGILVPSVAASSLQPTGISLSAVLLWSALVCLLASLAFSLPVSLRAFRRSFSLGLLAPFFVLAGNVSFVLGTLRGLIIAAGGSRRLAKAPASSPQPPASSL